MILLESNQNHATAKETDVCTSLPASMGMGGGYVPMIVVQRRFSDVRIYETETATTIENGGGAGGNNLPMVVDALPFDTTQVTSPMNYSVPHWGDACHPLAARQHPPAVAVREDESMSEKEPCSWDGSQIAPTLTARNAGGGQRMPDKENFNAVIEPTCYGLDRASYNQGKNAQYDFSVEEEIIGAQVAKGPGAVAVISEIERGMEDAASRNPILRLLRKAYGAQAVVKWGIAVLAALQQAKVLQQRVHEECDSGETENGNKLDGSSLPCPSTVAGWLLRDVRKQQERGCASQGRESTEQQSWESTEALQELSYSSASPEKDLFDMWSANQGIGVLQQALSEVQKIWESAMCEWKRGGDAMTSVVRRLTPLE